MDRLLTCFGRRKTRPVDSTQSHPKDTGRSLHLPTSLNTLAPINAEPVHSAPVQLNESNVENISMGPIQTVPIAIEPTTAMPAPASTSIVVTPTPTPSASQNLTPNVAIPSAELPTSRTNTKPVAWASLHVLVGVLEQLSGPMLEPLKSAVHAITECVELYEIESKNRKEYAALKADLEARFRDLAGYFRNPVPPTMTNSIVNLANGITQEINAIRQREGSSTVGRYARARKDADDILGCYRRINTLVERLTQNANMNIWKIVDEQATEHRLEKLCQSPAARYNSKESSKHRNGCTPQTRVKVLADMKDWAYGGPEKVYWLNGMAGTGKTTIACSLSEDLYQDCKLAASFFCSRDIPSCRDVNLILPTISYQLARFSRPFKYALSSIIEQDPDVHNRKLLDQFGGLISGPLQAVRNTVPEDLIVVIDGLDECDNRDDIETFLKILLSKAFSLPIKFFIGSRPESEIISQMEVQENGGIPFQLRLHELEHSTVNHDIETFLKEELGSMNLPPSDLQQLVDRCDVLFIYAATAVRYITSGGRARRPARLKEVLDAPTLQLNGNEGMIDGLYSTILVAAFDDKRLNSQDREDMRNVLHSVVCAQEPLTLATIACLLKMRDKELVIAALEPLLSLLSVSRNDETVNTLHASFPDYLFDKDRSQRFYCSISERNAMLTYACFDVIKTTKPSFNICRLESSFVSDKDVPDITQRVEKYISAELFYACRYWSSHLRLSEVSDRIFEALDELLSERLLLWMEVMNLKQSIHSGAEAMSKLNSWTQSKCSQSIQDMIGDASRFTRAFSISPMRRSTPSIYVSGLVLWPKQLEVSRRYSPRARGLIHASGTALSQKARRQLAVWKTGADAACVACSPKGTHVAVGSSNGTIEIWDTQTGQMFCQPLKGHTSSVISVSYSPDGTRIVSGSGDNTVRIWDAETSQMIGQPLEGHTSTVTSVSYSPDGTRIVSGSYDNTLRIWDAESGQMIGQPLEGHTSPVTSASYSPDGTRIVSGSGDKTMRIWDAETSQMIGQPLEGHTSPVTSASYSPDGTRIVSGSSDNTVRIWDAETSQMIGQPLEGHTSTVRSVSYSPDGTRIVSGSGDKNVRIWDAQTGQMIGQPLEGHTNSVDSVSYSPDSTRIVSGSLDKTVRIWDAESGQMIGQPLEGHTDDVNSVSYSPDGTRIVSGSGDKTMRIWDAETSQMIGQPLEGHTSPVTSASYSPDGTRIVSGSGDNTVRIWDAQTGQMIGQPLEGHTSTVTSVSYSPDGIHIVSGSLDGTVRIWDAETGQMTGEPLEGHTDWVRSVSYSPDGTRIVSGSGDKTVRIWDAETGQTIGQPLEGHNSLVASVSYSPDGTRIVSGSEDNTVRIWDAVTGEMIGQPLEGHTRSVTSVSYSPDGTRIVSGSYDNTLRIWDAESGQMIGQPLEGHTDDVNSVSYSPDGTRIVSGSGDKTMRIWDAETSQMIGQPLEGHADLVSSVSYSPDSTRIISGSEDNTIRMWYVHGGQIAGDDLREKSGQESIQGGTSYNIRTVDSDGWVLSSKSELLIWVPPELHASLLRPQNTAVIYRRGWLRLDFTNANIGTSWVHCYEPETSPRNTHFEA